MRDTVNPQQRSLFIFKKEYENIIFELAKGEGSTMTFAQTVATINNQVVTAKPRDISLVRNLQKGLNYVIDLLENKQMEFSKYHLCTINNLVALDDNHDNIGGFRRGGIRIGGARHRGVNPVKALDVFEQLENDFNAGEKSNENIIKLALILYKHQFFGDGNKRTAQLMMNGLLVANGFTPFVLNFKEENNINALIDYYDEDNIKPLYDICLQHQEIINQSYHIPNQGGK